MSYRSHLATATDTTGTSYLYDPDGKTLYLPGQELHYTTSSAATTTTRYYSHTRADHR